MSNFETFLQDLQTAGGDDDPVSVAAIHERLGGRSFGPLLLIGGLPSMTPVVTVPGLSSVFALITFLTAGQLLFGLKQVWLPEKLRRGRVKRAKIDRFVRFLAPVARFLDRFTRQGRLGALTRDPWLRLVAATCCILALAMPPLEFVPFTSGIPAAPVAVFGLALVTDDGLLVVLGFVLLAALAAATAIIAGAI